jgi:hypothetical protein
LEQCKSALSHNALSDWSEDLWKTIANWLVAVESKKVDGTKATFRLYVTPPKSGKVSSAIHDATSADAVDRLLKQVKDKLSKKAEPPKCMLHVQKFLDVATALRNQVICKTSVFSNDADPIQPLRALLAPTVPDGSIDVICEAAIGMAQARADRLIRDGMPALIGVGEFRKSFHAFVQQNNMPGYSRTEPYRNVVFKPFINVVFWSRYACRFPRNWEPAFSIGVSGRELSLDRVSNGCGLTTKRSMAMPRESPIACSTCWAGLLVSRQACHAGREYMQEIVRTGPRRFSDPVVSWDIDVTCSCRTHKRWNGRAS